MGLNFVAGIAESLRDWFSGWFGAVLSIIPKTFYFLCTLAFQVLDILQLLVRKVAGLDVVYYAEDSEGDKGDIAFEFIKTIFTDENSILSTIFWALIILGVILLIITTFIAVLRSEYAATDSKSASKGKIIGKAFKAIASFAIVPIVCFFGVFLANVVLQALDTITSGSTTSQLNYTYQIPGEGEGTTISVSSFFDEKRTNNDQITYISYNFWGGNNNLEIATSSTPISGLIFKAAAYKANRIRYYDIFKQNLSNKGVGANVFDKFGTDYDQAASLLDDCFANNYQLKTSVKLTSEPFEKDYMVPFGNSNTFISNYAPELSYFDKNNVNLVWFYYDLWQFDFLLGIAALIICLNLLIYLVFGLMKRIFELVVLFLIAPPVASIMPLDDGEALKKWKGKFISKVLGAYGPIVGLNLFFVILPLINNIRFFNMTFLDSIINLLFTIVGLIMVKDLVGTISELIGAENGLKAGQDMAGEVGQTVAKVGQLAAAPVGFAVKGAKFATKMSKNRQNKRILDKANYELLDDKIKNNLDSGSPAGKKSYLRAIRKTMSEEEKNKRILDYSATHGVGPVGRVFKRHQRAEERLNKLTNKISTRAGAMEANGLTAEDWKNLSPIERAKYLKEQKQKESMLKSPEELLKTRDNLKQNITSKEKEVKSAEEELKKLVDSNASEQKIVRARENYRKKSDELISAQDEFEKIQTALTESNKKDQRLKTARDIATLQKQGGFLKGFNEEALKKGAKIFSAEFAKSLYDNLTPLFNILGDNLTKGFKDAGGWGKIQSRMLGLSGKEEKISEEIKNQKRILSAQSRANELLGRSRRENSEPTSVKLDSSSINNFANVVADKLKNTLKKDD